MNANPLPRASFILILFILSLFLTFSGLAQGKVVAYANAPLHEGDNLAGNPLWAYPVNHLTNLTEHFLPPNGTTISLWNPTTGSFDRSSTYWDGVGWSEDLTWNPGEGALLNTLTDFVWTFVGSILAPDGSFWDGGPTSMPPPFDGPSGLYLLSSKFPGDRRSPAAPVFEWVVGRAPQAGEQFTWLVASNQTYYTTTYTGTNWDNGEPSLPLCSAAFFNLLGVPSLRLAAVSNQAVISWPAWATNFILETSSLEGPGAVWSPLMNTAAAASNSVTLAMNPTRTFYRLHKP